MPIDFFNDLSTIKYQKTNTGCHHENKIAKAFGKHDIEFEKHPNGTHRFPDFRIKLGEDFTEYDVECKSSKSNYIPLWNCTYPQKEAIYIFTNKKHNETLVFSGNEIITDKISTVFEEYKIKHKELAALCNKKLQKLKNPYGLKIYPRNMFTQSKNLNILSKARYLKNVMKMIKK